MTEYFVITRTNNDNCPLLEWDQGSLMFRKWEPVSVTAPVRLRLGQPEPVKPVMVDYHSLPKPVVSDRIKNVLEPLNIYGIQLLPARVKVKTDEQDYWLIHIYNKIACMDLDKSDCKIDTDDGSVMDIQHLVLNDAKLTEIPLERRLVFVLDEYTSVYLFHKTIKEAIMSVNPEGVRFIKVDEWNSDSDFA